MMADASFDDAMRAAVAALGRGDLAGAEQGFAAATRADPAHGDAWFNLGWVQRARRRFVPALESYATALAVGVAGSEEAHVNRAAILADHLYRPVEAKAEFLSALKRHPDYSPALLGLAQLHEDEGEIEAAREAYDRLLRRDAANGRALARRAVLDLPIIGGAAAAAHLGALLAAARQPEDRAELLFALATAQDAAGRYADAFATQSQANGLAQRLSPAQYDPAAFAASVDRQIAAFAAPLALAPQRPVSPIFICGLFRSGSTLAEQILARHPAIVAAGEMEAIPAIASDIAAYPEAVGGLDADTREALADRYRAEAALAAPGPGRRTDKRCDNFLHLGLVATLFPDAAIVHTRRHPLDNLLSTLFLRFGDGVAYGHRWQDAVHHAVQQERLMVHWKRVIGEAIHDLDYDALVRAPRETLASLLGFLGLPWDDRLLSGGVERAVRTASSWQVRQPLHARSSGRWQHYADQLSEARAAFAAAGVALPD